MPLAIASAKLIVEFTGASVASASVRYVVSDTASPALQRRGTLAIDLPGSIKTQLAQIIEDELRNEQVM